MCMWCVYMHEKIIEKQLKPVVDMDDYYDEFDDDDVGVDYHYNHDDDDGDDDLNEEDYVVVVKDYWHFFHYCLTKRWILLLVWQSV